MNAAIDPALVEEAARWFVLLASGEATADDHAACAGWRAADSRHEAAWQHVSIATARFSDIPRQHAQASVAALTGTDQRSGRRRFLAQLGILGAVGIAARQGWRQSDWSADQRTAIGEQRNITLADGSLLRLDTDTAIDIEFSAAARLIRLRRGRIMVATATAPASSPAAARPAFLVETAEGRIEALGTQFVVQQESDGTRVTVLQARVAIHASRAAGTPILAAGETARFGRRGIIAQDAARPGSTAWIKGILVADDMPLADFVAELARYRSAPLACAPAVRQWRISGTYPLIDTEDALAAIGRILPVRTRPLHPEDPARGSIVVAR